MGEADLSTLQCYEAMHNYFHIKTIKGQATPSFACTYPPT